MTKKEQLKFIEDNYPLYNNHISNRRIRHTFFDTIETELQAYLLGFYAADGSIDEKRKTLRVHLQSGDSEIVYLFKDSISPDARTFTVAPHIVTGRNGMKVNAHASFGVDITSSKLCNALVDLGIGYNKSVAELKIPSISEDLVKHFIRGYFDGDGCFSMSVRKPNAKNREKNYRVSAQVEIYCKRDEILKDVRAFILKELGVEMRIYYIDRDDMFKIRTSKSDDIKSLFSYIYDGSVYLNRKFSKFSYYVNTEVSQIISDTVTHRE